MICFYASENPHNTGQENSAFMKGGKGLPPGQRLIKTFPLPYPLSAAPYHPPIR